MIARKSSPAPRRFMGTIYKIWMMRHVDVPEDVARDLVTEFGGGAGAKNSKPKYIPVVATVNGRSVRTTLVPAGGGLYRLQIVTAQRKAARADVGDMVGVEIQVDHALRDLPIPVDLRALLKEHAKAQKAFEKLPPGHRRQFLLWLARAKGPETRKRAMNRALDILLERAILGASARARGKKPSGRAAR